MHAVFVHKPCASSSVAYAGPAWLDGVDDEQTAPKARTGWLGVQINDLTRAEAKALGWDQPRGAKVVASIPGGPAAKAGLLPGDILIAIDERSIANPGTLMEIVATKLPGTAVRCSCCVAVTHTALR